MSDLDTPGLRARFDGGKATELWRMTENAAGVDAFLDDLPV